MSKSFKLKHFKFVTPRLNLHLSIPIVLPIKLALRSCFDGNFGKLSAEY